jgi:hypothetical protein
MNIGGNAVHFESTYHKQCGIFKILATKSHLKDDIPLPNFWTRVFDFFELGEALKLISNTFEMP